MNTELNVKKLNKQDECLRKVAAIVSKSLASTQASYIKTGPLKHTTDHVEMCYTEIDERSLSVSELITDMAQSMRLLSPYVLDPFDRLSVARDTMYADNLRDIDRQAAAMLSFTMRMRAALAKINSAVPDNSGVLIPRGTLVIAMADKNGDVTKPFALGVVAESSGVDVPLYNYMLDGRATHFNRVQNFMEPCYPYAITRLPCVLESAIFMYTKHVDKYPSIIDYVNEATKELLS